MARASRSSLACPQEAPRVKHHAALPYRELPAFMRRLRERDGVEARGLEFVIVTAARAGEAVAADWSEIDWADGGTWIVPPNA